MNLHLLAQQVVHFTSVGACGALIDWGIFNFLTSRRLAWGKVPASVASTSCAMVWSFLANWGFVFHPDTSMATIRLIRFLIVTCCSGWLLQSLIIRGVAFATSLVKASSVVGSHVSRALGRRFDWIERNVGKVLAIGVGFIWNFLFYRGWVYAQGH